MKGRFMDKFPAPLAALMLVGSIGAVPILGWGVVAGTVAAIGIAAGIVKQLER